jgi:hypothetical protein
MGASVHHAGARLLRGSGAEHEDGAPASEAYGVPDLGMPPAHEEASEAQPASAAEGGAWAPVHLPAPMDSDQARKTERHLCHTVHMHLAADLLALVVLVDSRWPFTLDGTTHLRNETKLSLS